MLKLRIENKNAIKACHKYFEETFRRISIDRGKPPNAKKANSIGNNTPNISITKEIKPTHIELNNNVDPKRANPRG
jgi:hypothetical protein